ncbi:unnamed protein product [Effrenium voratum]|uniref:Uncharacterized protein n=1 Tax=Effrenium voratum TaxID=2562239 RepID=A0AA36I7M9_9DINO|nr:unnamed protein product [Effrenium voratum]
MTPGANAWSDRLSRESPGTFAFWRQDQQLSEPNWFGDATDATPEELALLQRSLMGMQSWEAPEEWTPSWESGWGGPDMEVRQMQIRQPVAMKSESEWSGSMWPWSQGLQEDPKPAADEVQAPVLEWTYQGSNPGSNPGPKTDTENNQPPESTTKETDADKGLAEDMASAVALFLAGKDMDEESDDGALQPSPSGENREVLTPATQASLAKELLPSTFGAAAIDAPPFVPGALQMGSADADQPSRRTELRLDGLLPKDLPSSEGMSDFLSVLKCRPLPLELEDKSRLQLLILQPVHGPQCAQPCAQPCSVFKGEVTRIILYCYKNRITPTVKMLQSKLRECQRFSEEQISAILQVCARDAPMLYHIQPPMRGEQPVIFLAKSPIWFQGFVNQEEEQQPQNTNDDAVDKGFQDPEVVKVFQQMLQDENLLLPRQVSEAASKLQQKVQPFWHVSTLELELMLRDAMSKKLLKSWADGMRPVIHRKNAKPMPIGPLAPGACNANNIGLVRAEASINGSQAESELSTENDKDNEAGFSCPGNTLTQARKDVTDLLTELVLAFPSGLRFSTLKEHLRTCNDGLFSETSFTCPAAKNWTEKVNGLSSMFAGPRSSE